MDVNTIKIIQTSIHYSLHLVLPFIIAFVFYRKNWRQIFSILLLTMLVDLDHLIASPIFDPNRCNIGFHPLHSYYAIAFYAILLFQKNNIIRIISFGLLLHMATDYHDCFWINYINSYNQ